MNEERSDKELLNDLENGELAFELTNSKGWKLIVEAMKRVEKKASEELINTDPADTSKIIQLQQIIKLYRKEFLPTLIEALKGVGEFAFNEAKSRNILKPKKV